MIVARFSTETSKAPCKVAKKCHKYEKNIYDSRKLISPENQVSIKYCKIYNGASVLS